MGLAEIARKSVGTLWAYKYLWFFGFFAGAAGASGGSRVSADGHSQLPEWVMPAALAVAVLGLLFILMNTLSESALIRGVAVGLSGESLGITRALRIGRRHFWTIAAIKILTAFAFVGSAAVAVAPLVLSQLGVLPTAIGFLLGVPLVLVAIPWFLTLFFMYQYAMRFTVLDNLKAVQAIRSAKRFLHGRLADSLKLTVLSFVGQLGGGFLAGAVAIPGVLVGLALYFASGMIPAIVVGCVLALPPAFAAVGAAGTFRSSVWTLGFLHART